MNLQTSSAFVAAGMPSVLVLPILGLRPRLADKGPTADGDPVHEEP